MIESSSWPEIIRKRVSLPSIFRDALPDERPFPYIVYAREAVLPNEVVNRIFERNDDDVRRRSAHFITNDDIIWRYLFQIKANDSAVRHGTQNGNTNWVTERCVGRHRTQHGGDACVGPPNQPSIPLWIAAAYVRSEE
jgi:hypothetical protein